VLLCYITDRTQFPGEEAARRRRVLQKIAEAARAGVDFIQLREKDLPTRELEALARDAVQVIRENARARTQLLINSRSDVALACGADGVHLRSDDISPLEVRSLWAAGSARRAGGAGSPVIGVSCHSVSDVMRAASEQASFVVFGPVFEKKDDPQTTVAGIERLREACTQTIPVLALGGITLGNARACVEAGAAGVAGIRLFQDHDILSTLSQLKR